MCLVTRWLSGFKDPVVTGRADRQVFPGMSPPGNSCDDDES